MGWLIWDTCNYTRTVHLKILINSKVSEFIFTYHTYIPKMIWDGSQTYIKCTNTYTHKQKCKAMKEKNTTKNNGVKEEKLCGKKPGLNYLLRLRIKFISEFLGSQVQKGNKTYYIILKIRWKKEYYLLVVRPFLLWLLNSLRDSIHNFKVACPAQFLT